MMVDAGGVDGVTQAKNTHSKYLITALQGGVDGVTQAKNTMRNAGGTCIFGGVNGVTQAKNTAKPRTLKSALSANIDWKHTVVVRLN